MFRGLFIEIRRGLKALEIQEKLKLSLLVQVGDWKFNLSKKMITNSFRFAVFYWGKIWNSKRPNWEKSISDIFYYLLLAFQRHQFHSNLRYELKVMIKTLKRVQNPDLNPIRFWLLLKKFRFNHFLVLIKLNHII
jgi:hypothetical protein